jgi:putrescine transport system substrate-binding protein
MQRVSLAAALGIGMALLASLAHAEDRNRTVNVYAWAEYFPRSVIEKFQRATGMHVNVTLFDSVNVAETTMSVGHSNFDIVTMNATPQLVREIPGGYWKKLERSVVPNAANADPTLLKLLERADPGNQYAVPWMWGTVGVMYNVDKVKALIGSVPAQSLDMVFDKKYSEKLAKCGIDILDSWGDVLPLVAEYLGFPKLAADPASLKAISAKLQEIKPQLRRIATAGYYEQIADGEMCVALGYSGDSMIARRMVAEGRPGSWWILRRPPGRCRYSSIAW